MRAERLTRAPEGGERITVDSLELNGRTGVAGDRRSAKDGSVSLLSGETEASVRGLGGLCTERFQGNILTNGLDYSRLHAGARLQIGESELEITRVGKPCFEVCAMVKRSEACPLPGNCAFARVLRGGVIHTGDEIEHCGR